MTATALNGSENGLLNYMLGQVFVVSARRPCLPPFLSLQSRWEGASLVENGCNFQLRPGNGKVASLVTSQERVSLLTLWVWCVSSSKPCLHQHGYFVGQFISVLLFSYLRPNKYLPNCQAKSSACRTSRGKKTTSDQKYSVGQSVRTKKRWNMTTTVACQVTSKS